MYSKRGFLGMSLVLVGVGVLTYRAFSPDPTGPRIPQFLRVHFATQEDGWALTSQGLAQSANGGRTWQWSVRWSPPLSAVGVPSMASWHRTLWVAVHHRIVRESLANGTSHWIPSPVRASTMATMVWTSRRYGWILAAPQGISAESEAVQVWTTTNGGGTWHQRSAPFVGVKTGLSVGGIPEQLWLGSTHMFHGSPLLWHAPKEPALRWQSAALPSPVVVQSHLRQTLGAPLWLAPLHGVLLVELLAPGANAGPIAVYRTQNGGNRWTWQGMLDRSKTLGTSTTIDRSGGWTALAHRSTTTIVHWVDHSHHMAWRMVSTVPGTVNQLTAVGSTLWVLITTPAGRTELWRSQSAGDHWQRM
jgi:hypothetical protein